MSSFRFKYQSMNRQQPRKQSRPPQPKLFCTEYHYMNKNVVPVYLGTPSSLANIKTPWPTFFSAPWPNSHKEQQDKYGQRNHLLAATSSAMYTEMVFGHEMAPFRPKWVVPPSESDITTLELPLNDVLHYAWILRMPLTVFISSHTRSHRDTDDGYDSLELVANVFYKPYTVVNHQHRRSSKDKNRGFRNNDYIFDQIQMLNSLIDPNEFGIKETESD